ncbi:MAG TPA: hypothetical protein VL574_10870 [Stellaceae bacterium]|jgi:hypothetical protein|nr:hypothetical protein [Stellaceae bacterium]
MHRTASHRILAAFGLATLLSLGACSSSAPPPPVLGDIRFQDRPPYRMLASAVEFDDQFQPSFRPPQVEQNMSVPPQRAMHNWIADRIQAADPSSPNHIQVTITDARVVAVPLQPTLTGLQATFTSQQTTRYEAHVAMTIAIIDGHGLPVRRASANASLSRSISEDATVNDRDRLLWDMSRQVTSALGQQLERQIDGGFAPYLQ